MCELNSLAPFEGLFSFLFGPCLSVFCRVTQFEGK
nr:MAG TPA: hypothetical protein [Caudoviricetes sp.]